MASAERIYSKGSFIQRHAREIVLTTVALGAGGAGALGISNVVPRIDSIRQEQQDIMSSSGSFEAIRLKEIELADRIKEEFILYAAASALLITAAGSAYTLNKYRRGQ